MYVEISDDVMQWKCLGFVNISVRAENHTQSRSLKKKLLTVSNIVVKFLKIRRVRFSLKC